MERRPLEVREGKLPLRAECEAIGEMGDNRAAATVVHSRIQRAETLLGETAVQHPPSPLILT